MKCVKTIFSKQILCAGSMCNYIKVLNRTQTPGGWESNTPIETFEIKYTMMGYIEAIKPTSRFNGINIADGITHLVYLPFEQTIYELDRNSLYIEIERQKNRRFKLEQIEDYGEQGNYLVLYCRELGFTDIEANNA